MQVGCEKRLFKRLCIRIGHYGAIQMLYYYYYYKKCDFRLITRLISEMIQDRVIYTM